jgi:DNA polymerase III delta prime subunit
MNELERKIYTKLISCYDFSVSLAKDIAYRVAEIAEKENNNKPIGHNPNDDIDSKVYAITQDDIVHLLVKINDGKSKCSFSHIQDFLKSKRETELTELELLRQDDSYQRKLVMSLTAENTTLKSINAGLAKMVEELKQQLAEIKYLSRDEVRKVINEYIQVDGLSVAHGMGVIPGTLAPICLYTKEDVDKFVEALCKLGLPTKDKIIEAIKKYITLDDRIEDIYELIAVEIIGKEGE